MSFFFSVVFCLFFIMNLILWAKESSATIPFSTLVALLALWFCVSVPLTFFGSVFGFRKRVNIVLKKRLFQKHLNYIWVMKCIYNYLVIYTLQPIEHPVRTNQIPRQIPDQSLYTQPLPGIIMGGVLPFGCIFIQLFFILNSLWCVML